MSVEELLNQALDKERDDAENIDLLQAFTKLLKITPVTGLSLFYLFKWYDHHADRFNRYKWCTFPTLTDIEDQFNFNCPETGKILDEFLALTMQRKYFATALRYNKPVYIKRTSLLKETEKEKVCEGCKERLDCFANQLSTPEKCYNLSSLAEVIEVKGDKVTLRSPHPDGTFTVSLRTFII